VLEVELAAAGDVHLVGVHRNPDDVLGTVAVVVAALATPDGGRVVQTAGQVGPHAPVADGHGRHLHPGLERVLHQLAESRLLTGLQPQVGPDRGGLN